MKYPTVSKSKAKELALAHLEADSIGLDDDISWEGDGPELDVDPLVALEDELRLDWGAFENGPKSTDRDLFEGKAAVRLHQVVSTLELSVTDLDDPGFWRYLTLAHFWWLVRWREPKAFASGDWARIRPYVDATNPTECVVLRMYLRGQITRPDYDLAAKIEKGTDFWRSHVLRVRTGSARELARGFAAEQGDRRMPTDELRAYARRLNRVWTNVVLHTYDADEAQALLSELRSIPPAPSSDGD